MNFSYLSLNGNCVSGNILGDGGFIVAASDSLIRTSVCISLPCFRIDCFVQDGLLVRRADGSQRPFDTWIFSSICANVFVNYPERRNHHRTHRNNSEDICHYFWSATHDYISYMQSCLHIVMSLAPMETAAAATEDAKNCKLCSRPAILLILFCVRSLASSAIMYLSPLFISLWIDDCVGFLHWQSLTKASQTRWIF